MSPISENQLNYSEISLEKLVEDKLGKKKERALKRYANRIGSYLAKDYSKAREKRGIKKVKVTSDQLSENNETGIGRALSTLAETTDYVDKTSNTYRVEVGDVPYLHRELDNLENQLTPEEEKEKIKKMLQEDGPMTGPEIAEKLSDKLDYDVDSGQIGTRMRDKQFDHNGEGYFFKELGFNPLE